MSRLNFHRSTQNLNLQTLNPVSQFVEIGGGFGRYGSDGIWQLHNANDFKTTNKYTIFICDKRKLDFQNKHKRKEVIIEVLHTEIKYINQLKHSRIIEIVYEVEESNDYLMFVTKPVIGSLADILEQEQKFDLTELEVIYGIYQITDALRYLHSTQEMMHCNLNLTSIIVLNRYVWKLGGLGFVEKVVDTTKVISKCTGYTTKLPCAAQPNLDYIAPEVQLYNTMSPLADIFSLGMIICAIYNKGISLIKSENNPTLYLKLLPDLPKQFEKISDILPKPLIEPVRRMISQDVRERPTSQLFVLLKLFNEPTLLSFEGLITLEERSTNQKKEFFGRFVKVVPMFKINFLSERILPMIMYWFNQSAELEPFVLSVLLTMIKLVDKNNFKKYYKENLKKILSENEALQTNIVLMDLLELFIDRLSLEEVETFIIPRILLCLDTKTLKSLETVKTAIELLPHSVTINPLILPKLKSIFNNKTSNSKMQVVCLACMEILLKFYNGTTICGDIIPFIYTIQTIDHDIAVALIALNQQIIWDNKNKIPYNLIGGKLLPSLIRLLTLQTLTFVEFRILLDLIRKMLDLIDYQRMMEIKSENSTAISESCSDINFCLSTSKNLPLIAMQRPTIDHEYMFKDENQHSQISLNDYRRSSGSECNNPYRWSRNNLLMQKLQKSQHRSESLLFQTRHRNYTGNRFWNEPSSNPTYAHYNYSVNGSRAGSTSFYIPSPNNMDNVSILRRYSGNLPTSASVNRDNLGSLNVPMNNENSLDPRRHSYGCTPSQSIKSLLTVNVCEGPFITPLNYRNSIHRSSAWNTNQFSGHRRFDSENQESPRRSSLNVISDMLMSTFKKVL